MVFTYPKVQYAKEEWGLNVTGEMHHQQNNLLNINCWSNTSSVCGWHVETHPPGISETSWVQFVIIFISFVWFNGLECLCMSFSIQRWQILKYFERFLFTLKTPPPRLSPLIQKSIEETCAISKDYVYVYQRTLKNISFHVNRNENKVAKS